MLQLDPGRELPILEPELVQPPAQGEESAGIRHVRAADPGLEQQRGLAAPEERLGRLDPQTDPVGDHDVRGQRSAQEVPRAALRKRRSRSDRWSRSHPFPPARSASRGRRSALSAIPRWPAPWPPPGLRGPDIRRERPARRGRRREQGIFGSSGSARVRHGAASPFHYPTLAHDFRTRRVTSPRRVR